MRENVKPFSLHEVYFSKHFFFTFNLSSERLMVLITQNDFGAIIHQK